MSAKSRSLAALAAAALAAAAGMLVLGGGEVAHATTGVPAHAAIPTPKHSVAPATRAAPPGMNERARADTRLPSAGTASRSELSDLIARDPAAAIRSIVERVRSARDEAEKAEALLLLCDEQALACRPEVAAALAEIATTADAVSARASATRMLGELTGESTDRIEKVGAIARGDASAEVREAAADALATMAERSPGELAARAAQALVANLGAETDAVVRATLLGSIRDTRDPAVVSALVSALSSEASQEGRDAAAEVLGTVVWAQRGRALDALASRFAVEPDDDVRRTILASIVRAGRADALGTLQGLRSSAGTLEADVSDYLAILASGEDDPTKVAALKDARECARVGLAAAR
jgi:hypothetical protein